MSLDSNEVGRIARLARLALTGEELAAFARDLSNILDLVGRMNEVDTAAVEPLAHPLDFPARLRADAVTESDRRDEFQAIAPAVADAHYLVPRVLGA